jgi:hypothetical protein
MPPKFVRKKISVCLDFPQVKNLVALSLKYLNLNFHPSKKILVWK